ncbi:DUF3108 domain-containing protein [Flavobacteriaceae bacterium M23B6Z8]
MKKVFTIFLIFFLCSFKTADPGIDSAFKAGEWFKFRIHYGIFNASYATLHLKNDYLNGKEMFHVIGKGRTTGLARLFFKVDDNYESYFDKEEGKPYRFIRQIDEGGYTKNLEINFDHLANKAIVLDKKKNRKTVLSTPEDVQDLLSAFYYLRNHYEVNDLEMGKSISLNMLYDDEEAFVFRLKYIGREVVRTKFGKVKCVKFRPYVQSGRVFKEKESLTLWVSEDDNKIPIRIKADLAVGSLKADLDAFKGLKHQFKIEM